MRTDVLVSFSAVLFLSVSLGAQQSPPPAQPVKPDFVIPKPDGAVPLPQAAVPPDQYVIGPADTLAITVVDEVDLTRKYLVDSDGTITMPYIGRQQAAGLTVEELRTRLASELKKDWIKNPQVLVGVEQYKARSVLVTGAVRSPQRVTLTGLTMSLLEALTLAGSPTASAANEVTVVRSPKPGQKEPETISVDRRDLEIGRAGRDIVLEDGDIINVPEAKKFYVSGAVKNTGALVYESGMTVARALVLAGGLNERG